ncbi:hypothetical protein [Riemerella anatipestifer]|uniref:hypothetical protein n=1 Tax=Riemerella anatipestifer TaxID=34085 RepID=UPI001372DD1B|nr:hypothetical protein [Riemerella anatipestifer]MBT0550383.1 hypothetical protein [Riemerella anatipestifer]MBT0557104.1 hypothetical protein [Riemerella anatipestifer]MBT0561143.1 hypothetical protein [Riemerella anatipestifer]NAV17401.1 hypothetical protein [Riemerella anatipestifer]
MTIQERILKVIENKGITPYRFCKDLGFSMGYLDKRGAIGTDKYLKIIEYLNDINPEWLLTGKGKMLKQPQGYTEQTPPPVVAEGQNSYGNNTEVELLRKQVALLEENRLLHQEIKQLQEHINRLELDNTSIKSKLQNRATG